MSSTALRLQPTTIPPFPPGNDRPSLRVLQGGRAPARLSQRALYRRRRLVAALVALGLVAALTLLAITVMTRIADGTPSPAVGELSPTSAVASSAAGVAAQTVVVQPGDTLWSIASQAEPGVDVRITVDRLLALNGSSPIMVGQELELPAT